MEHTSSIPHVLIFPYPAQGHINSMLKLAELLCLSGFHVTFINTIDNCSRLLRFTEVQSRFACFPGFLFETVPNFLGLDDLLGVVKTVVRPAFREMLTSGRLKFGVRNQVTCIIADGILGFAVDVAKELGIPSISFRTISACCVWIYFCLPKLIENGEIPFKDEDMDRVIKCVPEMKGFLRHRDLPSLCGVKQLNDPALEFVQTETFNSTRATAQILNTFEDLEGPILSQLRSHWPNLYTIGPLHTLLSSRRIYDSSESIISNSLWEEDRSCMAWLDLQPLKSVVYVSYGSLATVSRDQLFEIWYGLVNNGEKFLWVRRPDSIAAGKEEEERQVPVELMNDTRERGYIVGWAPQEEVLLHPAIGGFLTHSGWNSTLESMAAGVPMICWPHLGDQQINSRYVSEVWKIGLDMKDKCDRSTVEKLARNMMKGRTDELTSSSNKMAEMAARSVSDGGSSYSNFEALVDLIRKISIQSLGN